MRTTRTALPIPQAGFWSSFWGMTLHPYATARELDDDPAAFAKGVLALMVVTAVYTLILLIFNAVGYPAAAPSVLPIAPEAHYLVQIWYQGPLFFAATATTAALLLIWAQRLGTTASYAVAFARISFASIIPFFFTTMLVELTLAMLLLTGGLQPEPVLAWLLGSGSWFPLLYQSICLIWMLALFAVVIQTTIPRKWPITLLSTVALIVAYLLPVALFIR